MIFIVKNRCLLLGINMVLLFVVIVGCGGPADDDQSAKPTDIGVSFSDPLTPFEENDLSRALLAFIRQAQASLDVAIHTFDEESVLKALLSACGRGVRVRVLVDRQVSPNTPWWLNEADCFRFRRVLPSKKQHGLMHHKFAIRDRQWVWTGSANWTSTGLFLNANDGVVVRQVELAAKFQRQFDWLFSGGYLTDYRIPTDPGPIQVGPATIRVYFSPDPQIENEIIRQLNEARVSVHLAMFYLTNDRLYRALLDAMGRGVRVRALLSHRGAGPCDLSEMDELLALGKGSIVPIQGAFHHKFAVIDAQRVIMGSANWTKAAFQSNFENLLMIEDRNVAQRYLDHFEALLQDARAYRNEQKGPVRWVYRHFNTVPGTARVEWYPIEAPEVLGYELCKSATPNGNCIEQIQIENPAAWFWVDRTLDPDTVVYYRVKPITRNGKGKSSTVLRVHVAKQPSFLFTPAILNSYAKKETLISVRFKVAGVRKTNRGSVILLSDPQRRDAFRVMIPACAVKKGFSDFDINLNLKGKMIVVSGELTSYLGPEIILYDYGQLEWKDEHPKSD